MKTLFAIDLGGTTIDMVEFCREEGKILQKKTVDSSYFSEKNIEKILEFFEIQKQVFLLGELSITGASALTFPDEIFLCYEGKEKKISLQKILEFESIARGGKFLSQKNSGLVISLGTGTAMVNFLGDRWEHVQGTGIGGGTFLALGEALLGTRNFEEISQLVEKGNLKNIDLSVGEIAGGDLGMLSADVTASNFAKYSKNSSREDIALGIANLVGQSIASLAVEKAKRLGQKNIIIGGKFSRLIFLVEKIRQAAKFFDMEIIVPENAGFMTSIGAVISSSKTSSTFSHLPSLLPPTIQKFW